MIKLLLIVFVFVFITGIRLILSNPVKVRQWCETKLLQLSISHYSKSSNEVKITTNEPFNTITIEYTYLGKAYQISAPFSRDRAFLMAPIEAKLIYKDGSSKIITQHPGIPYTFSAKNLGGESIILTNLNNFCDCEYGKDTPPNHGKEVFSEE